VGANALVLYQLVGDAWVEVISEGGIGLASGDGIYALAQGPTTGESAEFGFKNVYVFPNPGAQPTFHIEAGAASSISVHIFNVSGEKVAEAELSGPGLLVEGVNAHEYRWDANVAPGIYLAVIRAHKPGHDDIVIRRKVAIVR
jgi:hypothetical protein